MATKVIKLKENNNTLIPVTDAKIVQMTYDGTTYSVHDVILDTEEAIATTYNHLSSRIENLEYYVDNPPLLNTDNSNSLTPMSGEEIDGTISLHKVAKTGSWDDLNDKPTIPPAPIKSNWNETNSSSLAYILNKPTIPAAPGALNTNNTSAQSVSSSESLSGNIYLHKISKTGNYNDLTHYPYETKVLVSKHINTAGTTTMSAPSGNFMISCMATGSTASFSVTVVNDINSWEWSTTDGKIFEEFEYTSDSSSTMMITVNGTLAANTDIVLTIYDVINGTGNYGMQQGLNGYIEGKRISHVGKVAVTDDYNDLINKPTIPAAANNGTLTIQKNGTQVQTFTANQSTSVTANITVNEPFTISVAGTGTELDPYVTEAGVFELISSKISAGNTSILVNNNGDYYDLNRKNGNTSIIFVNTQSNGLTKVCTIDSNDGVLISTFKSPKIENYADDSTINNLAPNTDGDFAYSEDSGDLYYGDESNDGAYKRILTDDNISTTLKTVNSTSLIGTGNIDAEDVEIGYLKTTSTTIQEGQGLPLTITSTDFYKVNSISHPSGGAVYEYSETAETGEYGKIYVDVSTNKIYHYKKSGISSNNNDYVELSPSPANYPKGYWIGTCDVASATVAKVILSTPYAYVTGNVLAVRFLYGNTVANPTLRIGNRTIGSSITGGTAYPIYYEGHALTDTTLIGANSTVTFVFDGSYYHIISIETNINNLISNAKTTKFGYLNSSGDFYEAYWSTLTDTTTSYYLPAVNQNTLSYTNNLYIDINTGKNYRYKNGTLGTGETRFEEIKPCIAKEKIVRTDRRAFRASSGTAINMESKYFYVFGSLYYDEEEGEYSKLITRLEIASLVNSYDDDKYENDFHGMVYCGASGTSGKMYFSLPEGIRIANDVTLPDLEQGYLFEFHILNGILTFTYTKLVNL